MNLYNTNPYGTTTPFTPAMYMQQQQQPSSYVRQEVVRVNGKNGADTYQLPPNSSILLLDESAPIVWLKTTDGAGYATVAAYDIVPHQDEIPVDTKNLEARVTKLEEILQMRMNQLEEKINEQSNAKPAQSIRKITPIEPKSN